MPTAMQQQIGITKFTNCRIVKDNELVQEDLWISSISGKIVSAQTVFYGDRKIPDRIIDLDNRIVSPGLIDVQMNGAFGLNFSEVPENLSDFPNDLRSVNLSLVKTGVTSYLPTMTSQLPETYHQLLPFLGPSGTQRRAADGAESLGAHCEGPFLSPTKNGIHTVEVLQAASEGFRDLEDCYGSANLSPSISSNGKSLQPAIKMITAAPEVGTMTSIIPELRKRDILFSIGHSEASFEDATAAVQAGATMITHLFNAMRPLHHRNPGIFGVLGTSNSMGSPKPFFGIIADGIHLHPSSIKIAYSMHPEGCILVTDAMHLAGLPDGVYDWTNGERIVKTGSKLILEGSDRIAGSSISLIECVNNFMKWSSASIPEALRTVTSTSATMLGLQGIKGTLNEGADADIVVFSQDSEGGALIVDQVWKFGCQLYDRID